VRMCKNVHISIHIFFWTYPFFEGVTECCSVWKGVAVCCSVVQCVVHLF